MYLTINKLNLFQLISGCYLQQKKKKKKNDDIPTIFTNLFAVFNVQFKIQLFIFFYLQFYLTVIIIVLIYNQQFYSLV